MVVSKKATDIIPPLIMRQPQPKTSSFRQVGGGREAVAPSNMIAKILQYSAPKSNVRLDVLGRGEERGQEKTN